MSKKPSEKPSDRIKRIWADRLMKGLSFERQGEQTTAQYLGNQNKEMMQCLYDYLDEEWEQNNKPPAECEHRWQVMIHGGQQCRRCLRTEL